MTAAEILSTRLINQQIAFTNCRKPEELVATLTAMQAQEFAQAKWAIGLRLPDCKHEDIAKAFDEGTILRTHLMRPTWHFIAPTDIRWMLTLTAPRVHAVNAYMYRKCALDLPLLNRSTDILMNALKDGRQLTRTKLNEVLAQNKIVAEGVRLTCIMMYAELEQAICSGPRVGNQFTYALLEERVPQVKSRTREEALVLLTERYFSTRGPATIKDFSTWAGLTITETKRGLAALPRRFEEFIFDDQTYYFTPPAHTSGNIPCTFLMPDYDEYGMSYKNRDLIFKSRLKVNIAPPPVGHTLIVDGIAAGSWKRGEEPGELTVMPDKGLTKIQHRQIDEAVARYKAFYSITR